MTSSELSICPPEPSHSLTLFMSIYTCLCSFIQSHSPTHNLSTRSLSSPGGVSSRPQTASLFNGDVVPLLSAEPAVWNAFTLSFAIFAFRSTEFFLGGEGVNWSDHYQTIIRPRTVDLLSQKSQHK